VRPERAQEWDVEQVVAELGLAADDDDRRFGGIASANAVLRIE
jgi:hypothetical protein